MPYQFCDESVYSFQVDGMLRSGANVTQEFRAGGFNIYPMLIFLRVLRFVNPVNLDFNSVLVVGRILMVVLPNALTVFVLYSLARQVTIWKWSGLTAICLYTISPVIFGLSRIWYPDHYIIFYSSILVLIILKILNNSKNKYEYFFFGGTLGILISIKYTGIFLLPLLVVLILNGNNGKTKVGNNSKIRISVKNFGLGLLGLFATFAFFNFSILFHTSKFLLDFNYNLANYARGPGIRYSGVMFYFYQIFVVSWLPAILVFWFIGILECFKRGIAFTAIFVFFPIGFVTYLGLAGTVINRNITLILPFIIVCLILGVSKSFCYPKAAFYTLILPLVVLIVSYGIFTTTKSFSQDLKPDSRIIASKWIAENIPANSDIGTNEFCSGPSPANIITSNIGIDAYVKKSYTYYVFNSYYPGVFFDFYKSMNILQSPSQKYTHFYHFNDSNVLKWSWDLNVSKYVPPGYSIIKRFAYDGPEIIIIKKVRGG